MGTIIRILKGVGGGITAVAGIAGILQFLGPYIPALSPPAPKQSHESALRVEKYFNIENVIIAGLTYRDVTQDPSILGREILREVKTWDSEVDHGFINDLRVKFSYINNYDSAIGRKIVSEVIKLRESTESFKEAILIELNSGGLMSDTRKSEVERLGGEISALDEIIQALEQSSVVM